MKRRSVVNEAHDACYFDGTGEHVNGHIANARIRVLRTSGRRVEEGEAPARRPGTRHAAALASQVDPVMVERLVAGQHPTGFTSWERRAAVRSLRSHGMSFRAIAQRMGIHDRQVCRDLRGVA